MTHTFSTIHDDKTTHNDDARCQFSITCFDTAAQCVGDDINF